MPSRVTMTALTSLLARDHAVPVRVIEEALQRQVFSATDIASALLELDALPENTLAAYQAAVYGLLPATRDELMRVSRDVTRLVPREVAEQHRLVPLAVEPGVLLVAASEPLDADLAAQLGFLLGHDLTVRIVCDVRLSAALQHHYAVDPKPTHRRLIELLRHREPGPVPYVAPPESGPAAPSRRAPPMPARSASAWLDETDDDDSSLFGPPPRSDAPPESPLPPRSALLAPKVPTRTEPPPPPELAAPPSPAPPVPPPESVPAPTAHRSAPRARTLEVGSRPSTRPPAASTKPVVELPASDPPPRPAERRRKIKRIRGPLSASQATKLLGEATDRSDVVAVFFGFARQFFDYAALFVAIEDRLEGLDAAGEGAHAIAVRSLSIRIPGGDESSALSRARRFGVPQLVVPTHEVDRVVVDRLERPATTPVVFVPVALRARLILLLVGDRGGEAFELADLPELVGFAPRVADALERLILRRKRNAATEAAPPSPPTTPTDHWSGPPRVETKPSSLVDAIAASGIADLQHHLDAIAPPHPPGSSTPSVGTPSPPVAPPEPAVDGADSAPPADDARPVGRTPSRSPLEDSVVAAVSQVPADEPRARSTSARRLLGIRGDAPPPPASEFDLPSHDEPSGRPVGTYRSTDVTVDVVRPRQSPSTRPPATRPTASEAPAVEVPPQPPRREQPTPTRLSRPDPRREDDSAPPPDVVHVPTSPSIPPRPTSAVPEPVFADRPTHDREVPSVIVDMGDNVHALVAELRHASPEGDIPPIPALLRIGEAALPALAQAFPGALWFDRRGLHRRLPRGGDVSAVARAMVAFREVAVPYVRALLSSADADVRFYALLVARELVSGGLVEPIAALAHDVDAGVRMLVAEVLPAFSRLPELDAQLVILRRTARIRGKDPRRRTQALAVLGALRDGGALTTLIDLLEDEDVDARRAAHDALVLLTCEDLGESPRRWSSWADRHGSQHRIEWLIEALTGSEEHLRARAGEELKTTTQQYFGYHSGASRREREVVQAKYRSWWEHEGARSFRRA